VLLEIEFIGRKVRTAAAVRKSPGSFDFGSRGEALREAALRMSMLCSCSGRNWLMQVMLLRTTAPKAEERS
jgi:hypothetical protein